MGACRKRKETMTRRNRIRAAIYALEEKCSFAKLALADTKHCSVWPTFAPTFGIGW